MVLLAAAVDVWMRTGLAGNPKFVLLALDEVARQGGGCGIVSTPINQLRRMTGLSRSGVQTALRHLERRGDIVISERGGGRGHPATYLIRGGDTR